jgi:hypothetical protein
MQAPSYHPGILPLHLWDQSKCFFLCRTNQAKEKTNRGKSESQRISEFKTRFHKGVKTVSKLCTTETEETRSYIIIPASAKARLAQDIITGKSPAVKKNFLKMINYVRTMIN